MSVPIKVETRKVDKKGNETSEEGFFIGPGMRV